MVRDRAEGRPVLGLEYEVHPELCLTVGADILAQARERFDVRAVACAHRIGSLAVGEPAVWIGVAGAHRDPAYAASRFVIEEIKARLPVWKRERFADGGARWVPGAAPGDGAVGEGDFAREFFRRQRALPEVGDEGQARLRAASIVVVGAGGLGCPALLYLARAGVGALTVVDGDRVAVDNLHRQTLYGRYDVGRLKAPAAAAALSGAAPELRVSPVAERLTRDNADRLLRGHDLALDCTDDPDTKLLLGDAAGLLGMPVVYAGLRRWEARVMLLAPGRGGGCLRCRPGAGPAAGDAGEEPVGPPGPVAGLAGCFQAVLALRALLGEAPEARLHVLDLLSCRLRTMAAPRSADCPLCGDAPTITDLSGES